VLAARWVAVLEITSGGFLPARFERAKTGTNASSGSDPVLKSILSPDKAWTIVVS
jgi:hypothetical protein